MTGRSLANAYANALGAAFTESAKPFEVELLVAEIHADAVELYHILYDGSITEEQGYVAIGGSAESLTTHLGEGFRKDLSRDEALRLARESLGAAEKREIPPDRLEVAGLDHDRGRRKFVRLADADVAAALG